MLKVDGALVLTIPLGKMDLGQAEISALRARVKDLEHQLEATASIEAAVSEAQGRADQAVSVLRNTEKRFSALFDSNVIGIIEINHERVLDANESFLKMTGQSREAVLSGGILWREITPSKYRGMDEQAHEKAILEGSFPPFEKEFYRRDGSVLPVWVGGVRLNSPPEWTCMAFVIDLSERKALEEQARTAQKLKTLGLLSSIIAHDFNNLLTTIIANATLALDTLGMEHPARQNIGEVIRAGQLASGLTDQLVNYSAKSRGRSQPVEMSRLVREIGDLIELPISRKVTLEWSLAPGLPPVLGDGFLIQQIVMNLVINAADSLGEQPGNIRIVTHCRGYSVVELEAMTRATSNLPAGAYIAVEVQDTGCGMTEATKERIFDPLFTTKTKGRGLGLASALGIVRSHRGAVDVRTKLGEGTTFVILFPADLEAEAHQPEMETDSDFRGAGTILVVDDEPSVRRLAEASLTRHGYRVIFAADGREGVDIYRRECNSISLILMDLSMPVMNGEEALDQLLAISPHPPILFSSGFNEGESLDRLAGYPFLRKPYTSRELAQKVKELHTN